MRALGGERRFGLNSFELTGKLIGVSNFGHFDPDRDRMFWWPLPHPRRETVLRDQNGCEWAAGKTPEKPGQPRTRMWWDNAAVECGADVTKLTAVIAGPCEEHDVP
jgi:hypothetical protein